jgi:hypothetical protein
MIIVYNWDANFKNGGNIFLLGIYLSYDNVWMQSYN